MSCIIVIVWGFFFSTEDACNYGLEYAWNTCIRGQEFNETFAQVFFEYLLLAVDSDNSLF